MPSATFRDFSGTAADNYQRYFVPLIATPVSADLLRTADLKEGERVLDVACGTGVVARLAAEQVGPTGSVTGTDVAPEMIEVATSIASDGGATIEWRVADAAELELADESCDVALCQMGLMFMADPARALAEMRRVLEPGGRIVVSTPGEIQPPLRLMEQAIAEHVDPKLGGFVTAVFSMHDPDEVATLLRDAGFEDVEAQVSTTRLELGRPVDFLWQYVNMTPMGAFFADVPDDAKAALERQVDQTWQPHVVDGNTIVEQPMVLARGRR